jgi:hypothetical protein
MDREATATPTLPNSATSRAQRQSLSDAVPLLIAAVLAANIVSMAVMNFFEIQSHRVTVIYVGAMVLAVLLALRTGIRFPALARDEHLFAFCVGLVLFLPRVPYLIEGMLGYSVNAVCFDDALHLQKMVSIVHTSHFPPTSTFDDTRYMSYYYAPWMLGGALYWSGLPETVKQSFGLTILVYNIGIVYAAVYASRVLFADLTSRRVFLMILLLYGGFDFLYWVSSLRAAPTHSEWWAQEFGFLLQYSNFTTLTLWTPHHLTAAVAILYGMYVLSSSRNLAGQILAGLLFATAVFSSVFVVLGATPIVAWFFIRSGLLKTIPVVSVTFAIISLPLWWIFLGKTDATGFVAFGALSEYWLQHKRAAFVVFLIVIALELLPLIAASFLSVRISRASPWLFSLSVLFILSTFFVSFSGLNNFAMRGSVIPILTLSFLAVPSVVAWRDQWHRKLLWIPLAAYALGGILEYTSFWRGSVNSVSASQNAFHIAALNFNRGTSAISGADIAAKADPRSMDWYLLERKVPPKPDVQAFDIEATNTDNPYRVTVARLRGIFSKG